MRLNASNTAKLAMINRGIWYPLNSNGRIHKYTTEINMDVVNLPNKIRYYNTSRIYIPERLDKLDKFLILITVSFFLFFIYNILRCNPTNM